MVTLRVSGIPRDNDTHTWADYLELVALVNPDSVCTSEFALDRLMDSPEEEQGEVETDAGHEGEGEGQLLVSSERQDIRQRARFSQRIDDALRLCRWRSSAYGDRYPFVVDAGLSEVALKRELSDANYSYLFLLMCGNLPFVPKNRNSLTDAFERYCHQVFEGVLPVGSEVHVFGKAAASAAFSGTKKEKLKKLAAAIRGDYLAKDDDFRTNDQGDGGIDLVGWHALRDAAPNIPVAFAQCACSREEWVRKQAEVMPAFLEHLVKSSPAWTPFVFIPVCFRSSSGYWAAGGDVKSVVLMDRLRILSNCHDYGVANRVSQAKEFVTAVSAAEEVV